MEIRLSDLITVPRSRKLGRRQFIGGSDARIIMSPDEAALIRLWKEKRGEAEPEDLSDNLAVQLGVATEALNQTWYERNTGRVVTDIQRWVRHPVHRYLAATLDGFVNDLDAVFEAKFMLPWSFSEEAAAEKHMAQLQHNMWVTNARSAALSIITGGGKWIEMTIPADALYQHFLVTAERRFWRCVQTGDAPRPYGVEPPRPRIDAVRVVDMSESIHGASSPVSCAPPAPPSSTMRGPSPTQGPDGGGHEEPPAMVSGPSDQIGCGQSIDLLTIELRETA